jgi:beta-lactamase regulating signal transducer with metallopeptidase domain
MTQTLVPYLTQLILSIGWSLLHSLWQGALIWIVLTVIFRAFPGMSARLKHACALMGLLILACWVTNTALTQWDQLQNTTVRVISGSGSGGYTIEVPPARVGFAQIPESAWVLVSRCMPWLMLAYSLGLLIMSVRFGRSVAQLQSLRGRQSTPADEGLLQLLETLKLQMGISQEVLLRLSTRIAVPMVIGVLRPLILLPTSMLETLRPGELEAILLHELAHVSRADFLINLLLSCLETLFFFNPFVWKMSASIHRDREHCCDDLVVAYTGQPLTYARVLASLAQSQTTHNLAVAATGNQPLLLNRIKRILEMKNHPLRYGQIIAAFSLAALLLAASIVCFTPSFAQGKKNANTEEPKASKTNSSQPNIKTSVVIVDSTGRHEYSSIDALPAAKQAQLQAAFDKDIQHFKDEQKQIEDLQVHLASMHHLNADSIAGQALKSAEVAMKGINWNAIGDQVDSAMNQVKTVDWPAMRMEVMAGLAEARRRMADTQWKAEMHRQTIRVSREIALASRNVRRESQRSAEEAAREVKRAEQRMEEARRELLQARAELKQKRAESATASKSGEHATAPAPPAPPTPPTVPLGKGTPAPPAPPAPPATSPSTPAVAPPAPPAPPTAPVEPAPPARK